MPRRRKIRELSERKALERAGCDPRLLDELLKSVQDAQCFTSPAELRGGTPRELRAKLATIRKAAGDVRHLLRSFAGKLTVTALGASKLLEEAGGGPKRLESLLEQIQKREVAEPLGLRWDHESGRIVALDAKNYYALPYLLESFAKEFESAGPLCHPSPFRPQHVALANLASYVAVFTGAPHDAEVFEIVRRLRGWGSYSPEAHKMWKSRNKALIRWFSSRWQDELVRLGSTWTESRE